MNEHRQDKEQNNEPNASFENNGHHGDSTGEINTSDISPVQANSSQRVLIVTAVDAEKDAVLRGLGDTGAERFDVIAAGVGPASAAAGTAATLAYAVAAASTRALAQGSTAPSPSDVAQASATSSRPGPLAGAGYSPAYMLVISAGIGGGFPGRADVGSLVVADAMVAADLGSQTPDGFLSVDELGFGSSIVAADAELASRLRHGCSRLGSPSAEALRSPCPRRPEQRRRPRSYCAACRMPPPKVWKASAWQQLPSSSACQHSNCGPYPTRSVHATATLGASRMPSMRFRLQVPFYGRLLHHENCIFPLSK